MASPEESRSPSRGSSQNPQVEAHKSSDDATEVATTKDEQPPLPTEDAPPLPSEEVPPLPTEAAPPLPTEAPPDDGWAPVWDASAQAFYFHNRFTGATQWENPRVPSASASAPEHAPGTAAATQAKTAEAGRDVRAGAAAKKAREGGGGYNPAIHGDFDPSADYAQAYAESDDEAHRSAHTDLPNPHGADGYAATGAFNRFTGRFQDASITPDNYNDENKSKRQMNAFFDVDAAANSHDGRSLRAERQGKRHSKKEIKAFKEKRREKKEEKRRAWLRD